MINATLTFHQGAASGGASSDAVMAQVPMVSEQDASDWLELYKTAWETGDTEAAVDLFAPEARFRQRQFSEPLVGHKALRSYWRNRVFEHQRDICFSYDLWGVRGNEVMAHWKVSYTWVPINGIIRMDGMLHAVFTGRNEHHLLAADFNQWSDYQEVR